MYYKKFLIVLFVSLFFQASFVFADIDGDGVCEVGLISPEGVSTEYIGDYNIISNMPSGFGFENLNGFSSSEFTNSVNQLDILFVSDAYGDHIGLSQDKINIIKNAYQNGMNVVFAGDHSGINGSGQEAYSSNFVAPIFNYIQDNFNYNLSIFPYGITEGAGNISSNLSFLDGVSWMTVGIGLNSPGVITGDGSTCLKWVSGDNENVCLFGYISSGPSIIIFDGNAGIPTRDSIAGNTTSGASIFELATGCGFSSCGNGIVDPGEECDGGSNCSSSCTLITYDQASCGSSGAFYSGVSLNNPYGRISGEDPRVYTSEKPTTNLCSPVSSVNLDYFNEYGNDYKWLCTEGSDANTLCSFPARPSLRYSLPFSCGSVDGKNGYENLTEQKPTNGLCIYGNPTNPTREWDGSSDIHSDRIDMSLKSWGWQCDGSTFYDASCSTVVSSGMISVTGVQSMNSYYSTNLSEFGCGLADQGEFSSAPFFNSNKEDNSNLCNYGIAFDFKETASGWSWKCQSRIISADYDYSTEGSCWDWFRERTCDLSTNKFTDSSMWYAGDSCINQCVADNPCSIYTDPVSRECITEKNLSEAVNCEAYRSNEPLNECRINSNIRRLPVDAKLNSDSLCNFGNAQSPLGVIDNEFITTTPDYWDWVCGKEDTSIHCRAYYEEDTLGFCSDGVCDPWENLTSCPSDCEPAPPLCGNNVCESGETIDTCVTDCAVCGDGVCSTQANENEVTCSTDCNPIPGNGLCGAGEETSYPLDCAPVCGDSTCETDRGENFLNCRSDCFFEFREI